MNDSPTMRAVAVRTAPLAEPMTSWTVLCFLGALVCDITYIGSDGEVQWANFAEWLLLFGEIFGLLALTSAAADWFGSRAERARGGGLFVIALALVLVLGLFDNLVHARDGWTGVVPAGVALSAIIVVVLFAAGFFGSRRLIAERSA